MPIEPGPASDSFETCKTPTARHVFCPADPSVVPPIVRLQAANYVASVTHNTVGRMYRYLTILLSVTAFSRVERAEGANLPVSVQPARGDFGADLSFLKRFYCPPQQPGESNHFIDIWGDQD